MRDPLQPDANAGGLGGASDTTTAPSAARLVLRLVVGGTLLAIENTGSALQRFAPSELPDEATATTPPPPPSARHLLIGALAAGPEWVTHRMRQLMRRGRALAAGVPRASRSLRFAARLLPTDDLRRWSNELRTRAGTTALNLAELGRREEQLARALAGAAASTSLSRVLDRIASNPQLRSVIREQSAGMGRSALNELRARSARADALAESVVGHLLPHARRKSSGGAGSP